MKYTSHVYPLGGIAIVVFNSRFLQNSLWPFIASETAILSWPCKLAWFSQRTMKELSWFSRAAGMGGPVFCLLCGAQEGHNIPWLLDHAKKNSSRKICKQPAAINHCHFFISCLLMRLTTVIVRYCPNHTFSLVLSSRYDKYTFSI